MMRVLSEIVVTLSSSPAISLVAKGTIVVALGLISAWFARRSRAAVCHALLASTFSVLLALPIVSFLATPVPIAVPVAKGDRNVRPLFDYISVRSSAEPAAESFSVAAAKSGWALPPLSIMLLCGWFICAAFFVIRFIRGLLEIRSLRRLGLPWRDGQAVADGLVTGVHRRVEVLLHESLAGPMTCGVLRPLIVLPVDAQSWDEQDLERALVHELEHVRRYDWAIHCLARLACAAYWFHPLVWTAWRQLTLEAERSCDDAVLRSSEATAYADQLVELARRRSGARKSPTLAMANRSDLSSRIRAVLNTRQQRGRAGSMLVALTCIVSALVVVTMSPLRMVASPIPFGVAHAGAASESFQAVTIKGSTAGGRAFTTSSPPTLSLHNYTLRELIETAYLARSFQIRGGPAWLDAERYDIGAIAAGAATPKDWIPMFQALLEDKFELRLHRETGDLPVYALTVSKTGLKLPRSRSGSCTPFDWRNNNNWDIFRPAGIREHNYCGIVKIGESVRLNQTIDAIGISVAGARGDPVVGLTAVLSNELDRLVIDKTGLTGLFDLHLEWNRHAISAPIRSVRGEPVGPSVFAAIQDQLGLQLEPERGSAEVLVVDHVEKPTKH